MIGEATMTSNLKKLLREPLTIDDIAPMHHELETASDRSSALLGGASVDDALYTLILS